MGLEQISKLTNSASFKLRLTMRKFTGETRIETYSTFKVANQVINILKSPLVKSSCAKNCRNLFAKCQNNFGSHSYF
jgi:hypothetical protein